MISTILIWSERFLAIATLLQAWELLQIRDTWSDRGVWRWDTVKKQYARLPKNVVLILNWLLNEKAFTLLLRLSIAASIAVWFLPASIHAVFLIVLFAGSWLTSIRWRGLFNGGSDSMTAIIALCLLFARLFSNYPLISRLALLYIAVQITASYVIAGVSKIRNQEWRRGTALSVFFKTPRYDSPPVMIQTLFENKTAAIVLSYALILFEFTFPFAWINSTLCLIFLGLAFIFHLLNFWVFGLNRFVFAWVAGYPALYYCSTLSPF